MKKKVYVTRPIPELGIDMLKEHFDVEIDPSGKVPSKQQLISVLKEKQPDALLTLLTDKIDGDILDAGSPNLKIVANYAVGYDNFDIIAGKQRGLYMTNTPGNLVEAVAEHTLALLLGVAKNLVAADQFVRDGRYTQWEPLLFIGPQLQGKTLGIVGMGHIGKWICRIAGSGFGMHIKYYDIVRSHDVEEQYKATFHDLEEVLKDADFLVLCVPLLPTTRHLLNQERLQLMKNSAIIINTARGPVVEEAALVSALEKKVIAGAGLDVFEFEPNVHEALLKMENVILTPHIASATTEARNEMARLAAENIIAALSEETPKNVVNG